MKRLLIADDDAGMRAALEARFRRRGWLVDVAVNARKRCKSFAPACIRWSSPTCACRDAMASS